MGDIQPRLSRKMDEGGVEGTVLLRLVFISSAIWQTINGFCRQIVHPTIRRIRMVMSRFDKQEILARRDSVEAELKSELYILFRGIMLKMFC